MKHRTVLQEDVDEVGVMGMKKDNEKKSGIDEGREGGQVDKGMGDRDGGENVIRRYKGN